MELIRDLSQRPDHFGMAGMADQNQFVPLRIVAVDFVVHLDDQRARGINDMQASPLSLLPRPIWRRRGR